MRSTSTSPPVRSRSSSAARQASWTAPAAIQVMREAEAEPADPTEAVSDGARVHVLDPELRAGNLEHDVRDALADLGAGAVHLGTVAGQHHARRAGVVEALGVADVLEAGGEASAAADTLSMGRVACASGQPNGVPRELFGLRRVESRRPANHLRNREGTGDRLAGRQHVARLQRVQEP